MKIKIGQPRLAEDVARIKAVREMIGPDIALMVDANYAMSVEQATDAARKAVMLERRFARHAQPRKQQLSQKPRCRQPSGFNRPATGLFSAYPMIAFKVALGRITSTSFSGSAW